MKLSKRDEEEVIKQINDQLRHVDNYERRCLVTELSKDTKYDGTRWLSVDLTIEYKAV